MTASAKLEIDFTIQQLELLDRLAAIWGASREVVVKGILEDAVDDAETPDQSAK